MKRHYYISADLDDLEAVEKELESRGVATPQIHVLSENDAEVEKHHLHAIEAVLKQDVVHSTQIGAGVGVICATAVLLLAYVFDWYATAAGWIPFIFLAVVLLGFCTWEGGLIGIQVPNYQFKRFQKLLKNGKHVFFVDVTPEQESILTEIVQKHPRLKFAGDGDATPGWVVQGQDKFQKVMKTLP
ncbi:NAD/FAD-utilizing enzyme [Aliiglaciecola litoralis]|uniref:Magnesium transporter n=1 Tax=Aliiglaciecola litoralis TaxID=582857 RepID=A0ABN1LC10_9ALTE